ncbi:multicomponent Na+:H+ antiporter subunit G [Mariniphaga anaerophila]|uniref:Multicomponent Na+:H+ antiporter subunit G n=1 Tax=Mariniphaga anaerophila TaxID=1484053 RepID=A0A1M5D0A5_9BACT|nr:monovalent cation/H(+) antiporter subunit G [Mariniphaga anaerophila]SHF60320.1 multicomponent Na+:H+ antiporter subunit G [Mariniphaga anaerophila]
MDKIIISIFILAGSFFILVAAIGLLRFKDLYARLHAGTKAPSFGILLLLIGVSIYFNTPVVYIKSLFIIVFIYLTAPLGAHAIAKSFDNKGKNKKQ